MTDQARETLVAASDALLSHSFNVLLLIEWGLSEAKAARLVDQWEKKCAELRDARAALTAERPEAGMIQADSSASEKVCDHPSTEKAVASLVEFFKWSIREGPWDGCDLDGASVQDKAESLGLIIKTQYEPEIHGQQSDLEVGDDYFVFSPAISTALLIANPANSLRSLPESSEPSLLGRETVREVTPAMIDAALTAWFKSPPSETDQGLERSMKAALQAALSPKE